MRSRSQGLVKSERASPDRGQCLRFSGVECTSLLFRNFCIHPTTHAKRIPSEGPLLTLELLNIRNRLSSIFWRGSRNCALYPNCVFGEKHRVSPVHSLYYTVLVRLMLGRGGKDGVVTPPPAMQGLRLYLLSSPIQKLLPPGVPRPQADTRRRGTR